MTEVQREKQRLYMQKWREKNRELHNESARLSHQKHKHKHKEKRESNRLLKTYGITLEQKRQMIVQQGGKCLICLGEIDESSHTDHCHVTGRVRGILCSSCNTKLGWYETNQDRVDAYVLW